MAMKHTLAAGVTALALLIAPVGLSVQWNEHGPALSTAPAVSTAHAAPGRPTPKKPPSSGGPTFTSSGSASRTTGWQAPGGNRQMTDEQCQAVADGYDAYNDLAVEAGLAGDNKSYIEYSHQAEALLNSGLDHGCAFTGPDIL
jgi:hypothetical protein